MPLIVNAEILFVPEYFNKVCNATIPPCFKIVTRDVPQFVSTNVVELQDEPLVIVANTPEEAIRLLVVELQRRGLTGKLRVTRDF